MDRRRFLLTSLIGALAAPLVAEGQQAAKVARVGYIATTSPVSDMTGPEPSNVGTRWLLKSLGAIGWVEGRNLIFERRSAEGRFERFGDILRELIGLPCDVIITTGLPMTQEALRVTRTIPIVFTSVGDAVTHGVVTSLSRHGRNVTGVTGLGPESEGKRLELLRQAVPKIRRLAVLTDSWNGAYGEALRAAASRLGMSVFYVQSGPNDYTRAFAAITQEHADAIYVGVAPYLVADRHRILEFATKSCLPVMGGRAFVESGALISYAGNTTEYYQRTANYVDRILRGATPADLPIEQITTYQLIVNLKTAKALGLTIPQSILARADEVIE